MTSDDPHAHCKRPVYNVYVSSQADAIVLAALSTTVEQLCEKAERAKQQNETGSAHEAYENAARLLDESLRAALAQYGEVREGDPE